MSSSGRTQLGRVGPRPDGDGTSSKSRKRRPSSPAPFAHFVGDDDLEFPVAKAAESRPLQKRLQGIHAPTAALPAVKPPRARGGEGNEKPKQSKEHLMAALQQQRGNDTRKIHSSFPDKRKKDPLLHKSPCSGDRSSSATRTTTSRDNKQPSAAMATSPHANYFKRDKFGQLLSSPFASSSSSSSHGMVQDLCDGDSNTDVDEPSPKPAVAATTTTTTTTTANTNALDCHVPRKKKRKSYHSDIAVRASPPGSASTLDSSSTTLKASAYCASLAPEPEKEPETPFRFTRFQPKNPRRSAFGTAGERKRKFPAKKIAPVSLQRGVGNLGVVYDHPSYRRAEPVRNDYDSRKSKPSSDSSNGASDDESRTNRKANGKAANAFAKKSTRQPRCSPQEHILVDTPERPRKIRKSPRSTSPKPIEVIEIDDDESDDGDAMNEVSPKPIICT
jgi:hypothetical protein